MKTTRIVSVLERVVIALDGVNRRLEMLYEAYTLAQCGVRHRQPLAHRLADELAAKLTRDADDKARSFNRKCKSCGAWFDCETVNCEQSAEPRLMAKWCRCPLCGPCAKHEVPS